MTETPKIPEQEQSIETVKPIVAIIGRPNVGKSTLYNRLTRSRDAIVDNQPGVTRDRMVGLGRGYADEFWVVDTGGIESDKTAIHQLMKEQVDTALQESDVVIFIVDGREGVSADDYFIVEQLRKQLSQEVFLAVNKVEGLEKSSALADFYALGLANCFAVSAKNGDGIKSLMHKALTKAKEYALPKTADALEYTGKNFAILGRPNVGKSTLINTLIGEKRVVVYDMPGTTRDSIFVPFVYNEKDYVLIDTAGMRKKSRVDDRLERFSVMKTLRALELAQVVAVVLDAQEGIVEQDHRILNMVANSGRSLMILVNKWDHLSLYERQQIRKQIDRKFHGFHQVPVHYISAKYRKGLKPIMPLVDTLYDSSMMDMGTGKINRVLADAVERRSPPMMGNFRIKMKFAHQGGKNPPHIILHGNQLDKLPQTYQRYLTNYFAEQFSIIGTKVKLSFVTSENPYAKK